MLFATLLATEGAAALQSAKKPAMPEGLPAAQQAEAAKISNEAMNALRNGDFPAALEGFEKLVKMAPGVAEFQANLGMAYYSAGRPREAIEPCRKALKLKPALTFAHYFLSLSLADTGQCREALPYLETDFSRVPEPQMKRVIGTDGVRCAQALDQPYKAVDFLRRLSADFPNDPDVLYLSTHIFSDLSTRASQQLLHSAPGSYQAHRLNAEVLELQDKVDDAIAEYRKVLELNPRLPGIHFQIGRLLLSGAPEPAKLEAARREFEEELRLDPADPVAEYELGEMARVARRWTEAIEHFERAVKIEPGFADALIGLGKSMVSAGRAQEAVTPLETAVKLEPENPVAHYQLSFAYRRVGREEDAKKELASYRDLHDKQIRAMLTIRAGIQGNLTQPQTAEPPE